MSDTPKEGDEKKRYWKRQTLTAKILIIFFSIIVLGVIAVIVIGTSLPTYTDLNVTPSNASGIYMNTLTFNGVTEPGATVTIDNHSVTPSNMGKFSYNLTNIALGTHNVSIVAKVPDKEPTKAIFEINRYKDNSGYYIGAKLVNKTNVNLIG
ncbi:MULTISPECIES: hypothetical protein [Methanobacterium]|uniref:Uncharacterized protein n=1 Tax=Methanobacterium veterum TaxID=408577 RepID=A0A9E4ZYL5_9EURY|nr:MULTISPECIES: hypothetical protein [Methanobacterium]MCZ3366501.1 hypothetical protein [Methanobacterium veterum]MCZ3372009.1 hypothetical protein [Methanobacterium veterum]